MISRNDPCWCGSGKKWKRCHAPVMAPLGPRDELKERYLKQYQIHLKSPSEIDKIRKACKLAAKALDETCKIAKAGVTTKALDEFSRDFLKDHKATSAAKGYGDPPFPGHICTSLNEVICHGIPNDKPLVEGDILNIDLACILDGYYGDCSAMVAIGNVSHEKQLVIDVSYQTLMRSIEILKPGVMLYEIGDVIEDYAKIHRCSVVNQFVGHGVGNGFHEPPQVPHHYNNMKIPMAEGMIFTIEPMINAGKREGVFDPEDGWTVRTIDSKPSAQWEHTILITKDSHEILTALP